MSSPINIARGVESMSDGSSSSSSPRNVYVPVHKRHNSQEQQSSSSAATPLESRRIPIYTPSELLMLASSPLSRLDRSTQAYLKSSFPEIVVHREEIPVQQTQAPKRVPPRRRTSTTISRRRANGKQGWGWPAGAKPLSSRAVQMINEQDGLSWRVRA